MGLFERAKARVGGSAGAVSSGWPQWTTLAGSGRNDSQTVVGESHYQDALKAVAGGRTENGPRRPCVVAELVREPKNRYDRNAVRVDIDGRTVGRIPAEDAPRYHEAIEHLRKQGLPATCRATILGGWDRGAADRGSFGVELDCSPEVWQPHHAFLPHDRRVGVTDLDGEVDEGAVFGGRSEFEDVVQITIYDSRVLVWHHGVLIGRASAKASAAQIPCLERLMSAGYPCTALARFRRPSSTTKRPFDVMVGLPGPGWSTLAAP